MVAPGSKALRVVSREALEGYCARMNKPIAFLLLAATAASAGEPAAQVAASTGGFDISMLDRAVDPCVDFYQFACGGWRARNPIPADQTRWGRFNELAERNREDLRAILEQARDASRARSATQARVGDYYAACMDEAGIEARGKAAGPAVPRAHRGARHEERALPAAGRARGLGRCPTLFRFGSAPDLHDSRQTIASFGQGGLGLPDRDDYLKDDAKSRREAGEVPRARHAHAASCWETRPKRRSRAPRRCCASRRRSRRPTSTVSRCATRRTATTR